MTRGKDVYTTQLNINLDARAKFNREDRKLQFDAVERVYGLLGDMSYQVDRINGVRDALAERAAKAGVEETFRKQLAMLAAKADAIRMKIVATKEGGGITGEERLREKASALYGALNGYEGRPADYLVARIDSLRRELDDVAKEFDAFTAMDLKSANESLLKKKMDAIHPLTRQDWDKINGGN
jgi:hypothetical protein